MKQKQTKPVIEINSLAFNETERTIEHYISTESKNRYGYALRNKGMKSDNYRLNPVVLYQHNTGGSIFESAKPDESVIGTNLNLSMDSKGIIAKTKFAETELGTDIMNMHKEGLLNAWSVGWNSESEFEELNGIPTMLDWELLEYSSVIIPGNPEAVNRMLSYASNPGLKNTLNMDLYLLQYKAEIEAKVSELSEQVLNINTEITKKDLTDFKNEIKSQINNNKKNTTDMLLSVASKIVNLESNLHNSILSKMQNMVETAIRKYIGKID